MAAKASDPFSKREASMKPLLSVVLHIFPQKISYQRLFTYYPTGGRATYGSGRDETAEAAIRCFSTSWGTMEI